MSVVEKKNMSEKNNSQNNPNNFHMVPVEHEGSQNNKNNFHMAVND